MRPRTAICQGAVYKGFLDGGSDNSGTQQNGYGVAAPISVTSSISRTSIGIVYHAPFDPAKHLDEDKAWYPDEGEWRANNQLNWYLRRV